MKRRVKLKGLGLAITALCILVAVILFISHPIDEIKPIYIVSLLVIIGLFWVGFMIYIKKTRKKKRILEEGDEVEGIVTDFDYHIIFYYFTIGIAYEYRGKKYEWGIGPLPIQYIWPFKFTRGRKLRIFVDKEDPLSYVVYELCGYKIVE